MAGVIVRRGSPQDLDAVERIQASYPDLVQWNPADYLAYDFRVAISEGRVAGFVVARKVAEGESELLNLAVEPACRRLGIGRRLLDEITLQHAGVIFLEVRESNHIARHFYTAVGFQNFSVRPRYYKDPLESAIVMKFHSC